MITRDFKIFGGEQDPIIIRASECRTYIVISQEDGGLDEIHLDVNLIDEVFDCIQQMRKELVV